MNYKQFFLAPLMLVSSIAINAQAPAMPDFSPQDFAAEMRRSKDHIKNLSPAEKEQLQKELEAATRQAEEELSKMSPEQLREIEAMVEKMMEDPAINEVLQEFMEELDSELPEEPMAPSTPTTPTTPTFTTPEVKTVEPSKQDKALALINNIITRTNMFLMRAAKMDTFSYEIEKWYTNRSIPRGDWYEMRDEIAAFIEKLEMLKMKHPTKNTYNSLAAFIEHKGLQEKLEQLSDDLTAYEPQVVTPEFGISELSPASQKAAKEIINSLCSTLYSSSTIKDINEVLKKYEPTAKKLLEEEEKRTKAAVEASKKKPELSRAQIIGKETTGKAGQGADYGYDYPYYGGGYTPSYDDSRSTPKATADSGKTDKAPAATGGSATGKDDKDKKGKEEPKKDKATEELESLINGLYEESQSLHDLLKNPILSGMMLGAHLTEPKDTVRPDLAGTIGDLNDAVKNISSKARKIRGRIDNIEKAKNTEKQKYTKQVNDILNKYRNQLMNIATQINSINQDEMSPVKRYAYFGGAEPEDYNPEQLKMIKRADVSLATLSSTINALYEQSSKPTEITVEKVDRKKDAASTKGDGEFEAIITKKAKPTDTAREEDEEEEFVDLR